MNKTMCDTQAVFIEKLANRTPTLGTFIVTGDPFVTEIFGWAGFDFVVIDTEHSPNDISAVVNHIRAAELSGLSPIVRVTKNDPSLILRVLDNGASGIVVPQVNTAAEAKAVVKAARYAPQGERGIAGVVRAARCGFTPMEQYIENANKQVQVIVQIEHIEAVQNLEEILAVEGIDGIFIGPTDLSQSMGITGQFNDPALRDVISQVVEQTKASDKWIGIFCVNAADAKNWADKGAVLLTIATDTMLIAQAARELKQQVNI
ncbi:hypothetical protein AXX12_07120 [Anaerosporomusa subterranea]|uniref:HpcH/HpaI aldolase/citrate lyase domain-containing protein n=1 Tax=Anaerosporomusa subterranea TaxID=1794912 RepID=A0A154BQJ3_ANASB|nr:aldolase/citrate lyase family protein [Anaerosporomusa subterranea]KYZ76206.1 hypothetical protein AXX12_07120 [Anaerosporomusa subterranea]